MRQVEIFWSFRSPYSYLATPRLRALSAVYDIPFVMRPVYPIAVRIPGFFKSVNPLWPGYLMHDVPRLGAFLGVPVGRPDPDPIVMDMATGEVDAEQPYIHRLTRLGVLASHTPQALDFFYEVSTVIWSGEQTWTDATVLADAVGRAGFDLEAMDRDIEAREAELEDEISRNETDQRAAGHWGVPLMVFNGEPFFGQDRIDLLEWRLNEAGVPRMS